MRSTLLFRWQLLRLGWSLWLALPLAMFAGATAQTMRAVGESSLPVLLLAPVLGLLALLPVIGAEQWVWPLPVSRRVLVAGRVLARVTWAAAVGLVWGLAALARHGGVPAASLAAIAGALLSSALAPFVVEALGVRPRSASGLTLALVLGPLPALATSLVGSDAVAQRVSVLWGLCSGVAVALWLRRVPVATRLEVHADAPAAARATGRNDDTRGLLRLLARSVPTNVWVIEGMCLVMAVLVGLEQSSVLLITNAATGGSLTMMALRWARPMPVPTELVARLLTITPVVAATAAFLTTLWLPVGRFAREPWHNAPRKTDRGAWVENDANPVALTWWERDAGTDGDIVRAPWGETVEPERLRLPIGTWYNPFTVRGDNSARFADWQFARLTKAVYGVELPRGERRARDWPRPRVQDVPVLLLRCGALLVAMLLFRALAVLGNERQGWRRWTYLVVLGVMMSAFLAELSYARSGRIMGPLLDRLYVQFVDAVPLPIVPLVVVLAVYGARRVLEWAVRTARPDLRVQTTPSWG